MSEKLTIPLPDDVQSGTTNMSSKRIAPGYFACRDMPMDGLYMASTRRTSKMVRPQCRAGRRRGYPGGRPLDSREPMVFGPQLAEKCIADLPPEEI